MKFTEKLHMLHRFWRYRLLTESSSVKYLLHRHLHGTTVLDIGANRGIYTYWMSKKVGQYGKVVSFEPQPELDAFLKDLKSTFNLTNVVIENMGLSTFDGKMDLYRTNIGAGGAHFAQKKEDPESDKTLKKIEVDVMTLDRYVEENELSNISFIKCDVEGHELSVFKGGEVSLKKNMPTILFECFHEEAKDGNIFSFLTNLGYRGVFIHEGKQIDHRAFAEYPYRKPTEIHRNYIFEKS